MQVATDNLTDRGNDLALVEAALFLSPKPMTRRGLAKILGDVRQAYVDDLLSDLAKLYEDSTRGIQLLVDDGRAALRVKREYVDRVSHLAPQQDIPRPVLRTLAVIAYNHPMTQADLIRVRGNKAYAHVQQLLERRLVRAEEHGRTQLLYVTGEFLRHFGLDSVEEFRFHTTAPMREDVGAPLPEEEGIPLQSEEMPTSEDVDPSEQDGPAPVEESVERLEEDDDPPGDGGGG